MTTHAAIIFLAGAEAYKMKRAVRLPFLDFTTLAAREQACRREIDLNRRTAPEIYRGVMPVTRQRDGSLRLGGDGEVVEWTVQMRRFDEKATLDRLAAQEGLADDLIMALADAAAALHEGAEVAATDDGAEAVAAVARSNVRELAASPALFSGEAVAAFGEATEAALAAATPLLVARARAGMIRRCHGDLHLGNIVLVDGRPVIFDALEFDEALATIDILYDLAFLLMDLWVRGERRGANRLLARWLARRRQSDDLDGLALLPLFLSMRAAIRAKVAAARASAQEGRERERTIAEARGMFASACDFLRPAPPRLVAIGGLSGTGKTTLAFAIAPAIGAAPGALVLRSDVERKAQFDRPESERLPADAYRPEVSERVYAALLEQARAALCAGHSVIIDAVHARPAERAAAEALAQACGTAFTGLWLEAPGPAMIARVGARRGDASDATAAVVEQQLGYDLGPIAWHRIATGGGIEPTIAAAQEALDPS